MVEAEHKYIVRQNPVKTYLRYFRMSSFTEDGFEQPASLEKTYRLLKKLAAQFPQSNRRESHNAALLRNAVVGNPGAKHPLSRIASYGLSIQLPYGELEASIHLDYEALLAVSFDGVSSRNVSKEKVSGILYEGQDRYVKEYVGLRGNYNRAKQTPVMFDPHLVMGCSNSDDALHTIRKLPTPVNAVGAAMRNLEYYARKNVAIPVPYVVVAEIAVDYRVLKLC